MLLRGLHSVRRRSTHSLHAGELDMQHSITNIHARRICEELAPLRRTLTSHRVYETLDSLDALRSFMEAHVFAVWDFMSLVKTLQQRLTCVGVPWRPPPDAESARIINEVVLGEESDVTPDGRVASHFELYLEAMQEVGADTRPVRALLRGFQQGLTPARALDAACPLPSTRSFVLSTLDAVERDTHEVAASFLLGRETLIPRMFEQVLAIAGKHRAPTLHWYLERHIQLDGDDHGPAGFRLLERLCGDDLGRWQQATQAAELALRARAQLWNGVCERLEAGRR